MTIQAFRRPSKSEPTPQQRLSIAEKRLAHRHDIEHRLRESEMAVDSQWSAFIEGHGGSTAIPEHDRLVALRDQAAQELADDAQAYGSAESLVTAVQDLSKQVVEIERQQLRQQIVDALREELGLLKRLEPTVAKKFELINRYWAEFGRDVDGAGVPEGVFGVPGSLYYSVRLTAALLDERLADDAEVRAGLARVRQGIWSTGSVRFLT